MSGAGTSSQNTNYNQSTNQSGSSNPWGPAIPGIQNILAQLGQGNLAPTNAQNTAAGNLVSAAGQIPNLGPSAAGAINSYLSPGFTNPYNNPALSNAFNSLNQQIGSGIAGQFAAAGRDPSGNAQAPEAIARGEAQAEAPILASQYNNLLGYQQSAIPLAGQVPGLYTQGPQAQFNAATNQANLPILNALGLEGATLPIAGLGGSYQAQGNTQGNQNTTNTASPLQDLQMAASAFGNIFGGGGGSPAGNFGTGAGNLLGRLFPMVA